MKDRKREKGSMVHIRFTEAERRKLKAICALKGFSMQEYIRDIILNEMRKWEKGKK